MKRFQKSRKFKSLGGLVSPLKVERHIFVDVSFNAYAAAAYLRISTGNEIRCSRIAAKSKVSPLKLLSVPRLELNAAVLGTRLAGAVKENHSIPIQRTIFWTDSKTVWSLVRSESIGISNNS